MIIRWKQKEPNLLVSVDALRFCLLQTRSCRAHSRWFCCVSSPRAFSLIILRRPQTAAKFEFVRLPRSHRARWHAVRFFARRDGRRFVPCVIFHQETRSRPLILHCFGHTGAMLDSDWSKGSRGVREPRRRGISGAEYRYQSVLGLSTIAWVFRQFLNNDKRPMATTNVRLKVISH